MALRLWIWRQYGCEYFVYFNWFLYLFTRPAILTATKIKIIFILVRNSNIHCDFYKGVRFKRRYQTRECNEHQPVPSGLVIYPCYQQCQQFHPNAYTSHDESPSCSESLSSCGSGSGSENANKRCEATEVKILISAYKDHQEKINNSKSNKGKNLYARRFLTLLLNIAKRLALEVCMTFVLPRKIAIRVEVLEPRYTKTQVWCTAGEFTAWNAIYRAVRNRT